MKFEEHELIRGVYLITPTVLHDERGEFFRVYCKSVFEQITDKEFVQMNHSINYKKGTLRGLHYQVKPCQEQKIVRCISGRIQDVFVDLREGSSSFLKYGFYILDSSHPQMLFLPEGIAHGFITLEDNTQLLYQHSEFYNPQSEKGILFNDPLLKIQWLETPLIISERDKNHPQLTNNFKGI
jgi:dTDP-4-dehydrorhamnose 3,5-epimerase